MYIPIRGAPAFLGVSPLDTPTQQGSAGTIPKLQDGGLELSLLLLATLANVARVLTLLRFAFRSGSSLRELGMRELAVSTAPSLLLCAQSSIWACYGHYTSQPNITRFNALFFLTCVFLFGCAARTTRLRNIWWLSAMCAGAVAFCLFAIIWLPACAKDTCRVQALSFIGSIVTAVLLAASLQKVVDVIRTRSVDNLPVAASAAAFISSALWSRYAWIIGDSVFFRLHAAGGTVASAEMFFIFFVIVHTVCRTNPNQKSPTSPAPKAPMMHFPKATKVPKWAQMDEHDRPMMPRGCDKASASYCDARLEAINEQQFGDAWCAISIQELALARAKCEEEQLRVGPGKSSAFGCPLGVETKRLSKVCSNSRCESLPAESPSQPPLLDCARADGPAKTHAPKAQRLYVRQPMKKPWRPLREAGQVGESLNVARAVDCIL